jgi:tetratricopeptide (TPR) repeat protein
MSLHRYGLIALLSALLSAGGCASYYASRGEVEPLIDELVAEQRYALALQTIEALRDDHPERAALEARSPRIRAAGDAHERTVLRAARGEAEAERFQPAIDRLAAAQSQVPDPARVTALLEALRAEQRDYLERLQLRQLLGQAEQLARALVIQREMIELAPRNRALRRTLEDLEREAGRLGQRLGRCAETANAEGDRRLARRCLSLAGQLRPDAETAQALDRLDEAFRDDALARGREEALRRAVDIRRQFDDLIAAHDQALEAGRLSSARELLEQAAELRPGDASLMQRETRFRALVDERVAAGLEAGKSRYAVGDIAGALEVWLPLLRVDPGHAELNRRVERAQRVLRNLRAIETRPPTVPLPR